MINIETATAHAIFHLANLSSTPQPAYGALALHTSTIGDCVVFYDIVYGTNEDPILYVFDLNNNDGAHLGQIAINATENIGRTFAFLQINMGYRIGELLENAQNLLVSKGCEADSILPVIYSYPKLGVRGNLSGKQLIVDIFSLECFEPDSTDPLDVQGQVAWSFWDEQPQGGDPVRMWKMEDDFISSLVSPAIVALSLQPGTSTTTSPHLNRLTSPSVLASLQASLNNIRLQVEQTPPATDTFVLATKKIGQENSVYCACASLQMIYEFVFEKIISQQDVANAMKTTSVGSTVSGQLAAFRQLFAPHFDAVLDRAPNIATLRDSTRAYLPVKSGIIGHARVAAGYRNDIYADPISGETRLSCEMLLIIDPEPIGVGTIRWEAFDPSALKDFIILKRLSHS